MLINWELEAAKLAPNTKDTSLQVIIWNKTN